MSILGKDVNRLLKKIKKGDKESKELLYTMTYNHLKVVARKYVYDKNDLEDVVQISYLRVFRYIDSWEERKDGYNWMCRIVQNESYRLNEKTPAHLPLEDYAKETVLTDATEKIFVKDEINRYFSGYSELDKKLVYMKFYEDYSYAEIAKKLNLKKSTVHRRVSIITKEILEKRKKELDESDKQ